MRHELLAEALRDDITGEGPRYRTLAATLRDLVAGGRLPVGYRLPAERDLAVLLGVSRGTIVKAYGLLRSSGWVQSTVGSGTYTRRPDLAGRPKMTDLGTPSAPPDAPNGTAQLINFSIAHPQPLAELKAAVHAAADMIDPYAGTADYVMQGLPELRARIAASYTARGLPTTEGQVLITAGAQQALSICLQLFAQRRVPFVLESPTYLGALDILHARRAHVVSVPSGPHGPDLDALDAVAARTPGAVMLLMPTCHTITGAVTDHGARTAIADIAARSSSWVIEDDILAGLTFDRDAPPLAALSPTPNVITIGATSKLFWNGLRVGWMRAPAELIGRLTRIKAGVDLGTSLITQLVVLRLLDNAPTIAARRVEEARRSLDLATTLLTANLPSWHWHPPDGGRSLWIRLPIDDVTPFVATAVQHGVSLHAGATFCPDATHTDHIRLMFVQPAELLTTGIQRLATAWADHEHNLVATLLDNGTQR